MSWKEVRCCISLPPPPRRPGGGDEITTSLIPVMQPRVTPDPSRNQKNPFSNERKNHEQETWIYEVSTLLCTRS